MAKPQKTFIIGNTIYRLMTVLKMGVKETIPVPMATVPSVPVITSPTTVEELPGTAGKDGTNGLNGLNGTDGTNGVDGHNGKNIELQVSDGALQWRQDGGDWQNLYMMNQMRGPRGLAGTNGIDGTNGINGSPGLPGLPGTNGKDGAAGKDGSAGTNGTNGVDGKPGAAGKDGSPGTNGSNGTGFALVGSVTVGQNATVAIALGIREITVPLTGAVAGKRYFCFARSYKLNGGASVSGRPAGYTILDCACNVAGQITVSVNAPLLAVGSSFALTCDVMEAA